MPDRYAIVVGRFYEELAEKLVDGARGVFEEAGAEVDVFADHPCEELRALVMQAPRGAIVLHPIDKPASPAVIGYIFNTTPVRGQFNLTTTNGPVPGR